MKQKNSTKNLASEKDPTLKIKYARGLGDFVACILHSKPVGWLTHFITGKNRPCEKCSKRADALNILFPIPFWRLFFKDHESLVESLAKDLTDAGHKVELSKDKKGVSAFKSTVTPIPSPIKQDENNLDKYTLVTSGDNFVGNFMIKIQIFEKK